MEREELEYQLGRNRASIQELKSERDRGKMADYDYKLLLEVALSEERFLSAVKTRLDLVDKAAQLKKELSSSFIDSTPPVTVFEEETSSYKVLSPRQYKELELQSAMFDMRKLYAEIPKLGDEYVRLYKIALRVLPGFKPDEIPKEPAAESVQMDNRVSTPSVAQEPPLESNPTQPPQSETSPFVAATPAPDQTKPKPVGPAEDLNPTPGNVLIDRGVLLALIGQMALKAPPGESSGVVTPPAHSSAPDEEPKKKLAKGRPLNQTVQVRRKVIRGVAHLEGEAYCAALHKVELSTPLSWQQEHSPCPKDYLQAWNHADPEQRQKWRDRISDEKYKATHSK